MDGTTDKQELDLAIRCSNVKEDLTLSDQTLMYLWEETVWFLASEKLTERSHPDLISTPGRIEN